MDDRATPESQGPDDIERTGPTPAPQPPVTLPAEGAAAATDGSLRETAAGPPPRVPPPTAAGQCFGPYRILSELGRGGMGVVYCAHDTRMNRPVALKTILGTTAWEDTQVERFRREVETVSRLRHRNIVTIHEVGECGGLPYFAMELLEGEPLSRILARQRALPGRAAARVVRDVARALAYAHEHGIVHRDVKPLNIMIEPVDSSTRTSATMVHAADTCLELSDGRTIEEFRVVLMDFGLARDLSSESRLTQSGQALGTPHYMSPEQAEGDMSQVDALSDVYSLGVVLYELLTGNVPFFGRTKAEILFQVLMTDPIPPRARLRHLSPDLEVICLKAMSRERQARYPSATAFADDLDRFLKGELIHARPPTRRERVVRWVRRHPVPATAGALLFAVAIVSLGVWGVLRVKTSREVASFLSRAEGALAAGRADEAIEAASRARVLAPSRADVAEVEGRSRAAGCVAACDQRLAEREQAIAEAGRMDAEAAKAAVGLHDWDAPEKKAHRWRAEDRARELRQRAGDLRAQAEQELVKALGYDRECAPAFERFCRISMEAWREAERAGDADAMRRARAVVELYDRERRFAHEFDTNGVVELASDPDGAVVHVFRYEPRDRRLVPCPFDLTARTSSDPPPARTAPLDLAAVRPSADKDAARAHVDKARALLADGSRDRGKEELLLSLDADLGCSEARTLLARVLAAQGDAAGAIDLLEGAAALQALRAEEIEGDDGFATLREEPGYGPLVAALRGVLPRTYIRAEGVRVDSYAYKLGLREGDVLLEVNGVGTRTPGDLARATTALPPDVEFPLVVWRAGERLTFTARNVTDFGASPRPVDLSHPPTAGMDVRSLQARALDEVRRATANPLAFSDTNRAGTTPLELDLPAGSYLLVLRAEGREDCRYPVVVSRGSEWKGTARLVGREDYPPVPPAAWTQDPTLYWTWVPAGPFAMGGDPRAIGSAPAGRPEVDSYFIARFELGGEEYAEFLNDPETLAAIAAGGSELRYVPRRASGANPVWGQDSAGRWRPPPGLWEWPVCLVSWYDAKGYVDWLNHRVSTTMSVYALPSGVEWEKAARGVDARAHPWGNEFDWSFCKSSRGRQGDSFPEPRGQFPVDEGPYGTRDLVGSQWEWVEDSANDRGSFHDCRGGTWGVTNEDVFRAARRHGTESVSVYPDLGFRLVARPK